MGCRGSLNPHPFPIHLVIMKKRLFIPLILAAGMMSYLWFTVATPTMLRVAACATQPEVQK